MTDNLSLDYSYGNNRLRFCPKTLFRCPPPLNGPPPHFERNHGPASQLLRHHSFEGHQFSRRSFIWMVRGRSSDAKFWRWYNEMIVSWKNLHFANTRVINENTTKSRLRSRHTLVYRIGFGCVHRVCRTGPPVPLLFLKLRKLLPKGF